ncbi:MAG: hypothetical protein KKE05_02515, partial [Nanoarchaeota archaeon]|nr:hypothetical protein [Nanoarchaeota archaeon]
MKELNVAIVISLILVVIGGGMFYFDGDSWEFNFHRAELTINGANVSERLYYEPNEPYHTLYRTFQDPAFNTEAGLKNYVLVNKVECEKGTAYFRNYDDFCVYFDGTKDGRCLPYTERNEYGCTFGGQYGFFEGNDYWIEAKYELRPANLFKVNGKNYIKFVVYSPGKHKKLGSNLVTSSGVVRKDVYYPNENVIVYVPFEGSAVGYHVFTLNGFEFDSSNRVWKFLFAIFPGFLFFGLWYFFGKEKT